MESITYFTQQNVFFLRQGIDVLQDVSDKVYSCNDHDCFASGIGRHFRHILDLYRCLVEIKDGRVDYDSRQRDPRIETDRLSAIGAAENLADRLEGLARVFADKPDLEIEVSSNEGENPSGVSPWCSSSLVRELQYLASHTVHHFALIAIILKLQGGKPPSEFGVAPSTLQFEKTR